MHEAIAFVDREGNQGIRRMAATADNFDDLVTRLRRVSAPPPSVPVYVLYTADMLAKFWAMRFLGAANQSVAAQRGTIAIRRLPCDWLDDEKAYCSGQAFDLRTGLIERYQVAPGLTGKPVSLRRTVMIEGGHIVRQRDYTDNPDNVQLTLEIILKEGILADTYLLDELAFQSNLNQMFALGRYDGTLFEEVYNNFPRARAFKVRYSSK
jgi:dolichyl-diphosphooligosaccharide--protein glycosyltransferase